MLPAWASTYGGRRSHDQPRSENTVSEPSSSDAEARRRSSSEATTPRPTPAPHTQHLVSVVSHDPNLTNSSSTDVSTSSRRLGFFTDKLSNSQSSHTVMSSSGHPASQRSGLVPALLHPHSHSRGDSALTLASATSQSTNMASLSSSSNLSKGHSSPSKLSSGRTYDSKLVSREMHRLGALAHSHLPAALAPPLSAAASSTSLALPGPSNMSVVNITSAPVGENPWGSLHVHLLPLFNGEPLRIPIEDLNILVKRHIQTVVSQSPSKALSTLEHDASELISAGMVTLNAKFVGLEDEKLLGRIVEIWGFFWDQVLPYVEGVLLPLQTDSLLSSLYRTPKTHRNSSPSRQNSKGPIPSSLSGSVQLSTYHMDVRTVALKSFRDKVVLPLFPRLYERLSMPNREDAFPENSEYQQPRLQQMLLVLASVSRQRPPSFSLTAPAPQPTAGEAAMTDLLRVLRTPPSQHQRPIAHNSKFMNGQLSMLAHAPNFLWGGLPRDRRGRVAQKQKGLANAGEEGDSEDVSDTFGDGAETPRNGFGALTVDVEREREREFLESLRSPGVELPGARASVGGWGLGGGIEDSRKTVEEDDEDEALDWDQAQAVVERMVGMKPDIPPEARRRT